MPSLNICGKKEAKLKIILLAFGMKEFCLIEFMDAIHHNLSVTTEIQAQSTSYKSWQSSPAKYNLIFSHYLYILLFLFYIFYCLLP
jgi:hypothetical protein